MNINQRIQTFSRLGNAIKQWLLGNNYSFQLVCTNAGNENAWFTPKMIRYAFEGIALMLDEYKLKKWIDNYPQLNTTSQPKTIGVVMAGNIPMVGFHDMLCVLVSGNKFLGKISSKDKCLMQFVVDELIKINPAFAEFIELNENQIKVFDAIIATGSNNSARYFDYYFAKYPHIIRKNRNSVAFLTGEETNHDLKNLADDIFLYYGLGCRNVSKIFVPEGYCFNKFFEAIEHCKDVYLHHKYANNYDYNRSIYLVNCVEHLDNGFLMLKEDSAYASPISVIYYEKYSNIHTLVERLHLDNNLLQCIVTTNKQIPHAVMPGLSQKPELWEYADNVDTVQFLIDLN